MTQLLDSNVLIALSVADHVHHQAARHWWKSTSLPFATCPITQGALLRLLVRDGLNCTAAVTVLGVLTEHPRHVFWPDDRSYDRIDLSKIMGHRQLTDTYLAALARHHGGQLATFDRGLAIQHPGVATLVPLR